MTPTALHNGTLLTDDGFVRDHALVIEGACIRDIVPLRDLPPGVAAFDLRGHFLLPGFIDAQVNGGGGVLFNDAPTVETLQAMAAAHRRFGTTAMLPTLITSDRETLRRGLQAVSEAIRLGVPGILGIHLEGPFLNPVRKGIHDERLIRQMDASDVEALCGWRSGRMLVTLAPEAVSPQAIRNLADAGVIVSAGHTDASYEVARAAIEHGLRGFTHLFNAMSPLTARHPAVTGAALEDRGTWCGLIVDGHHVSPASLRIALRCKSADRLMLVTDAMSHLSASFPPGVQEHRFELQGRTIMVRQGACRDERGTLAGSSLDMASAVRNARASMGVSLIEAVRMASASPAEFLGVAGHMGRIAVGHRANLVWADRDLEVLGTWIDGHPEAGSGAS